ncbi:hypothetical protein ACLEPN_43450 [Myxococcus sp. 1LA]
MAETITSINRLFRVLASVSVSGEKPLANQPAVAAFDSGSFWIEVALDTGSAVTLIGVVTRSAHKLLAEYQQAQKLRALLDAANIKIGDMQSAKDFNTQVRQGLADAICAQLKKGYLSKNDTESINSAKQAILEQAKLIEQGVEMMPQLTAPAAQQQAFPTREERALFHAGKENELLLTAQTESSLEEKTNTDANEGPSNTD